MTPAEREGPSEGAVREQLREEPGPRASRSPAEGGEAGPDGAAPDEPDPSEEAEAGTDDALRRAGPTDPAAPETSDGADASAEGSGEQGAGVGEAEPDDALAAAERERDQYLALAQRTQADFENFRRRAARDAAAAGARAKAGLVRELLPAIDNLERALAASDHADDGFARGVQMVHGELIGALERNGVAAFEPTGEAFDPMVHEAISTRPADGAEPGLVLDVVEKGYRLDETVLRPARVVVSA